MECLRCFRCVRVELVWFCPAAASALVHREEAAISALVVEVLGEGEVISASAEVTSALDEKRAESHSEERE